MPNLQNHIFMGNGNVDPTAANTLYRVWKTSEKDSKARKYPVPEKFSEIEIQRVIRAGLGTLKAGEIEVTEKGAKVIKEMILGDDRNSFEDDGSTLAYTEAVNNTKGLKTASKINLFDSIGE